MSAVLLRETDDRLAFVRLAFEQFQFLSRAAGRTVLLKPNIVSHEPYPTTTHPSLLEACLTILKPIAKRIIVADGPAWDAPDPEWIIDNHPLKGPCDRLGVPITDLLAGDVRTVRTRKHELEVSLMAFECDLIVSIPVLKTHGICGMTGALKNQLGFLSLDNKRRLHHGWDVNSVIAELNEVVVPSLHIVDAVETMTFTNEARHGGRQARLGYMLAGTDPLSLDVLGLELLGKVEPRLEGKSFEEIPHLRHAAAIGLGESTYEIIKG
jgi:uncharacterized protein (DUF362 family)